LLLCHHPTQNAHFFIDGISLYFAPHNKEVTMKKTERIAIFRLSVLGPLVSRQHIERGELKKLIRDIASRDYAIPYTDKTRIAEKTIEGWYYAYLRENLDGLKPKKRMDRGVSKISSQIQDAIIKAKRENPRRSIDQITALLTTTGVAASDEVSRSSIHRLLKQHGISRMTGSSTLPEEFRSFETQYSGQITYGDVMHGPTLMIDGRMRKVYLVSLMDDASRLITHSAFCLGETALDIEGVLKQAVLKRGLPTKLVIDNGAAYRSGSLKGICARLGLPFTRKSRHRILAHGSDQGAVRSQWWFYWQAPQRRYGPCARIPCGPVCACLCVARRQVRTRTGRRAARRPSAALRSLAMEQPFLRARALHMTTGRPAVVRLACKGQAGYPHGLLPPLCAGGQGETGALAPHLSQSVSQ